jgi:hypothetical protein
MASGGGGNSRDIQVCGNIEWNAGAGDYNGPGCMPPTWTGCAGVLPVSVISLRAGTCGRNVCLDWDVSSESGLKHYEVERLGADQRYESVGIVRPAGLSRYQYVDSPPEGASGLYYRIKSLDQSGDFQTTVPVIVYHRSAVPGCIIFPNPTNGAFSLDCSGISREFPVTCNISNQVGEIVASILIPPGSNEAKVNNLPTGLYFCSVGIENQVIQRLKLIVE